MKQNDVILPVSLEDTHLVIQLSLLNPIIGCSVERYRVYDVSLSRLDQNGTKTFECLTNVALKLIDFLKENPKSVLYYYCDDVNDVDRRNRNISKQEYRHRLFSQMFNYLKRTISKGISDESITCEFEGNNIFIHLIYFDEMKYAADELKQLIKDQTSK